MKKQMRSDMMAIRDCIDMDAISEKSLRIKAKLFSLSEFKNSQTILFYVNFRSEVETIPMIEEALSMNKRIIVPVVVPGDKSLLLSELKSLDELTPGGKYGILEPHNYIRKTREDEVELVVVPGLAFDREGYRLGYGGGYYDRLIKKLTPDCLTAAVGFEMQVIDSVPHEQHDMRIKMIITEERIIDCRGYVNEGNSN